MIFDVVTLTVGLLYKKIDKLTGTMSFESEGLIIVAIYIWLPPASYVVFLTTLVVLSTKIGTHENKAIQSRHNSCKILSNIKNVSPDTKYRGMFETQKVRRHDKFRKEWSQQ